MSRHHLMGLGAAGAAAVLGAAWFDGTLLRGWLVAFAFWSSVPLGAVFLLMMMRLIPGAWRRPLSGPTEAAVLVLPLALLGVLPVLAGVESIYPWAAQPDRLSLVPWLFRLRSILFMTILVVLPLLLLLLRPRWSVPVACAGLIVFVLADTTIAVDWLMSLEPDFHSSGFGLYVLSIQATISLAMLVLWQGPSGGQEHAGALGALMFSALLLWFYFAFMQYFIIWSGNLPGPVAWYQHRLAGGWGWVAAVIGLLHGVPLGLLLFSPVRHEGRWLRLLALAVLAGKALELVWLVLPPTLGLGAGLVAGTILALLSLGALTVSALGGADRVVPVLLRLR